MDPITAALQIDKMMAERISGFFGGLAQADTYKTQARLSILADKRQGLLEQEQLRSEAQNVFSQYSAFLGAQKAAHAASGFTDYSTGDVRVFSDTVRKQAASINSLNQSYTAQRQEAERQALMNAIQYRAQAKASKYSAYTSLMSGAFEAGADIYNYNQEAKKQKEIKAQFGQFSDLIASFAKQNKGLNIAPVA